MIWITIFFIMKMIRMQPLELVGFGFWYGIVGRLWRTFVTRKMLLANMNKPLTKTGVLVCMVLGCGTIIVPVRCYPFPLI